MSENSSLEAMLAQYEAAATSGKQTTFDLANYFTTYLKDGVDNKMMKIRILPTKGRTPFEEVYVHSAKLEGKNRKFVCPSHTSGAPCAFCDAKELLLATGEKEDADLAKTYNARLMYIVKVIDREKESEGPKFWRFPKNFKKEGILDKIMATVKMLGNDITDPEKGRDLVLNVVRVKSPRGDSYPTVNSIQATDSTPLTTDEVLKAEWLADTKGWSSVYTVKGYDYLEIVVRGGTPVYDKKLEKFVDKDTQVVSEEDVNSELDAEISIGANKTVAKVAEPQKTVKEAVATVEDTDVEDDDLPF